MECKLYSKKALLKKSNTDSLVDCGNQNIVWNVVKAMLKVNAAIIKRQANKLKFISEKL